MRCRASNSAGLFRRFSKCIRTRPWQPGASSPIRRIVHRENVAVIGENIATALYGVIPDAVGKNIMVDGSTFQVIGVLQKPVGGFGTNDEDRRVVLPYYTFRKIYPAAFEIFIRFLAYPGQVSKAVDEVRDVLRRRRNVPYDKPGQFFHPDEPGDGAELQRHYQEHGGGDYRAQLDRAADWRRGRDEYHAGLRDGADAGNWRAEGHWRAEHGYYLAIFI